MRFTRRFWLIMVVAGLASCWPSAGLTAQESPTAEAGPAEAASSEAAPAEAPATDAPASENPPSDESLEIPQQPADLREGAPADDATPPATEPPPAAESPGTDPAAAEPAAHAEKPQQPELPAGLEDLGPELEVVSDGGLELKPVEMPAYWGLLKSIKDVPAEELEKQAKAVTFDELMRHPAKYRGQLVTVDLSLRKLTPYELPPTNPAEVTKVYEVWGWPTASSGWLYVAVLPELPPGVVEQTDMDDFVRLTGRFMKLQGYQPGDAELDAKPLRAPLIIGKVRKVAPPPSGPAKGVELYFGLQLLMLALVAIGAVRLMILMRVRLAQTGRAERLQRTPRQPPEEGDDDLPPAQDGDFDWVIDDPKK